MTMAAPYDAPHDGGCACHAVSDGVSQRPLFVHCCHCTWCKRETGSAFVLDAMIESEAVTLLSGAPEAATSPTASGAGQKIARRATCKVAVWSHDGSGGETIRFVRVGILGDTSRLPPDVRIFASTQAPWLTRPADVPAVPEFYDRKTLWPPASLERLARPCAGTKR